MAHKCDGCKYKGEHQEMMFRPFGVCNRGANLLEAAQNYEAKKCPYKKTNADRIRAMSDEELAEDYCKFLNAMLSKVAFKYKLNFEYDMEKGKSIMLKYLQQPAEGE